MLIEDLGILREISLQDTTVVARVSPTYSGCPAVTVIEQEIELALQRVLDDHMIKANKELSCVLQPKLFRISSFSSRINFHVQVFLPVTEIENM